MTAAKYSLNAEAKISSSNIQSRVNLQPMEPNVSAVNCEGMQLSAMWGRPVQVVTRRAVSSVNRQAAMQPSGIDSKTNVQVQLQ